MASRWSQQFVKNSRPQYYLLTYLLTNARTDQYYEDVTRPVRTATHAYATSATRTKNSARINQPSRTRLMYGGSTNAGGTPATVKLASDVASPATFLATSLTVPARPLMLATSVRMNKFSSTTVSITTLLLGFNFTPFKNLQRHKSATSSSGA